MSTSPFQVGGGVFVLIALGCDQEPQCRTTFDFRFGAQAVHV